MNRGNDFLSIKDLTGIMVMMHYNSAWKRHKAVRKAISPGKRALTIQEYCQSEGLDEAEVRAMIGRRGGR